MLSQRDAKHPPLQTSPRLGEEITFVESISIYNVVTIQLVSALKCKSPSIPLL